LSYSIAVIYFQKTIEVEAIARVNGVVPASIDILYGMPHIGKFFIFLDGIIT
jgi:pseudouridine-5'-phosphate glycosidase